MLRKIRLSSLLALILLSACASRSEEEGGEVASLGAAASTQAANAGELVTPSIEPEAVGAADIESDSSADSPSQPESANDSTNLEAVEPEIRFNRRVGADQLYEKFAQLLPFDGIRPVYEPRFSAADQAPYLADELVMGVALEGQAKAYPVSVLRFREMVNDELAGTPILVSW